LTKATNCQLRDDSPRFSQGEEFKGESSIDALPADRGWPRLAHRIITLVDDVKRYREDLVAHERRPTTIAHKLNVLRRVYAAAVAAGLRADNPAVGIRAPRYRRAPEDFGCLSEVELALLFRAVPHGDGSKQKHLRDHAVLGLLGLQAMRTVELMRTNVRDLQQRGDDWALLVRGKFHDRLVFLRPDVADALRDYLAARGDMPADALGEPLLTAVGNFAPGHRLSRRGLRVVVDSLPAGRRRQTPEGLQPCAAPHRRHPGLPLLARPARGAGHARSR
jgi:site-specific recombinase XerD